MTTTQERTQSVLSTQEFLFRLLRRPSDGGFHRVPKEVRALARRLLKHYPLAVDLTMRNSFDREIVEKHLAKLMAETD